MYHQQQNRHQQQQQHSVPDIKLAQNVFELVGFNDSKALRELEKEKCPLLIRNENQETPLSLCLRDELSEGVLSKEDILETLEALLEKGAAESVFVKGYQPASLICTLPMAQQPESSSFSWPQPIKLDSERLAMLDKALAEHIKKMWEDEKKRKNLANANVKNNPSNDPSSKPKPVVFNQYPTDLKVGDFVRRGPDWSYSNQDENKSAVRHAGIVTSTNLSQHNISVSWHTNVKDPKTVFGSFGYA